MPTAAPPGRASAMAHGDRVHRRRRGETVCSVEGSACRRREKAAGNRARASPRPKRYT